MLLFVFCRLLQKRDHISYLARIPLHQSVTTTTLETISSSATIKKQGEAIQTTNQVLILKVPAPVPQVNYNPNRDSSFRREIVNLGNSGHPIGLVLIGKIPKDTGYSDIEAQESST